jgi:hypothetical protein
MGQEKDPVDISLEYSSSAIIPILGISLGILKLFLQHLSTMHHIPLTQTRFVCRLPFYKVPAANREGS